MNPNLIPPPNYTQFPNVVIDYWMARLPNLEFKCLMAIARKTIGWHKQKDKISYRQFCDLVGASKRSVIRAIQSLVHLNLVSKTNLSTSLGDSDACEFELKLHVPLLDGGSVTDGTRGGDIHDTRVVSPMTPTKETQTKENISKVYGSDSRSMPFHKEKGKSMVSSNKFRLNRDQSTIYEWLLSLKLKKTKNETLSWWAKKYSMARLEEVYREAIKRNAKCIGAYMRSLLEKDASVIQGRIEQNAHFARDYKAANNWRDLEIHQKYAYIIHGNCKHEIPFDMESIQFAEYLMKKHETFGS